jgi:hypothetical protein
MILDTDIGFQPVETIAVFAVNLTAKKPAYRKTFATIMNSRAKFESAGPYE